MWFAFSLITILCWGGSDLFSKLGTRREDPYSHWRLVIIVGLVMGLNATAFILINRYSFNPLSILRYFPVSLMYILSMTLGYAGLRYIELSVSSPICNSSGAVTALLCFLFLGQRMEGLQLFAVLLISGGLVALAIIEQKKEMPVRLANEDKKYRYGALALLLPFLYCLIDGLGSFMDAYYLEHLMSEDEANIAYQYTFLIAAAFGYWYLCARKKQPFAIFREKAFLCGAVCETAGQFSYVYAMGDNAIVAAPMIASYSILSVLLSRIFLKEKLGRLQYLVIAVVMIGIAILGME